MVPLLAQRYADNLYKVCADVKTDFILANGVPTATTAKEESWMSRHLVCILSAFILELILIFVF